MAPGPGCHTDELTRLTYVLIDINAWNRLGITVGATGAGMLQDPTTGPGGRLTVTGPHRDDPTCGQAPRE
jgi:hypothetical protein